MDTKIIISSQRDELMGYVSDAGFICLSMCTYEGEQIIPIPKEDVEAVREALKKLVESVEE